MSKLIVEGGSPLQGEITVAGNKNAALPIIAATVLTEDECILENVPDILDVRSMLRLLSYLGKDVVQLSSHSFKISGNVTSNILEKEYAGNLRASILFLGGLLGMTKEIRFVPPGGCVIGKRNMDSHFNLVKDFGGTVERSESGYHAFLKDKKPASILLKEVSVTGTENAMILAANIPGTSVIENAACEPHVEDLAKVLIKMGAEIKGSGTNRITIKGREKLSGLKHRIVPDHIEAGTFAIAAAVTHGHVIIQNAIKSHLRVICRFLESMSVDFSFLNDHTMEIKPAKLVSKEKRIQVGLWPNFPTDLMSPAIVLATQASGTTLCHDWMFESRMFFVDKLNIMGADIIQADPHRVIVSGASQLYGQHLHSPDIRAGIALVIAALSAKGQSVIDKVEIVDRGYENIEERLCGLGAKIIRQK